MLRNYKDVAEDVNDAVYDADGNNAVINNGVAYIKVNGTRYIVDSNTQFVDVDEGVAYVGYENVPDYVSAQAPAGELVKFWAIDTRQDNGVLDVVFIYSGESSNDNKTYFYVTDKTEYETHGRNEMYKDQEVFIDGQRTTLTFTQSAYNGVNDEGLYVVERTDGDGYVTNITYLGGDIDNNVFDQDDFLKPVYVGANSFGLGDGDEFQWVTNNDTLFVNVIYDLNDKENGYKEARVRVGDLKDMDKDEDYDTYVYVAKPDSSDDPAELVFIVDVEKMAGQSGPDYSNTYVTKASVDEDNREITVKALATATDKTATITKELQNKGYSSIFFNADGTVSATKDSVGYTFTVKNVVAKAITYKVTNGEPWSITGTQYAAAGDKISVTVSFDGTWYTDNAANDNRTLTVNSGLGLKGTTKTVTPNSSNSATVELTVSGTNNTELNVTMS